ncbi:MAG: hypothetical protein ACEQSL_10910 [Sediminibacterium sp.]
MIAKNNRGLHEANEFMSVHLHQQIDFPERAPHLGNCYVLYPQGKEPKKLSENDFIGVPAKNLNRLKMQKGSIPFHKMLAFESMIFRTKRDFNTHRLLRAIDQNVLLSKLEPAQQADENEKLIQKKTTDFLQKLYEITKLKSEKLAQEFTLEAISRKLEKEHALATEQALKIETDKQRNEQERLSKQLKVNDLSNKLKLENQQQKSLLIIVVLISLLGFSSIVYSFVLRKKTRSYWPKILRFKRHCSRGKPLSVNEWLPNFMIM